MSYCHPVEIEDAWAPSYQVAKDVSDSKSFVTAAEAAAARFPGSHRRRKRGRSARLVVAEPSLSCASVHGTTDDEHCALSKLSATDIPSCCISSLCALGKDLKNIDCITMGRDGTPPILERLSFVLHKNDRCMHAAIACTILVAIVAILAR
tara:strand:- start:25 stop:477 length:453 start_codon:yes stop_codon:yes gene_type:complete